MMYDPDTAILCRMFDRYTGTKQTIPFRRELATGRGIAGGLGRGNESFHAPCEHTACHGDRSIYHPKDLKLGLGKRLDEVVDLWVGSDDFGVDDDLDVDMLPAFRSRRISSDSFVQQEINDTKSWIRRVLHRKDDFELVARVLER
jgi:hypothetical protein